MLKYSYYSLLRYLTDDGEGAFDLVKDEITL
jgi:hypothetical protein